MPFQFRHHYTREEARALLPEIRRWLGQMRDCRTRLDGLDERLAKELKQGNEAGGEPVNSWIKTLCATKKLLLEFGRREIQVKDLGRGLIDFPAVIGEREVYLCWEEGEEDIEFWHDLDVGYSGRERL